MANPPSITQLAAALRHELAAQWLTPAQAGRLLGAPPEDDSRLPANLRKEGKILGVWVPTERGYRYPPWQFGVHGTLVPQLQRILALLRQHGDVSDGDRRSSGWNEVEWFMTPHVDLDGATPQERLARHPDAVLAAAQAEFLQPIDESW